MHTEKWWGGKALKLLPEGIGDAFEESLMNKLGKDRSDARPNSVPSDKMLKCLAKLYRFTYTAIKTLYLASDFEYTVVHELVEKNSSIFDAYEGLLGVNPDFGKFEELKDVYERMKPFQLYSLKIIKKCNPGRKLVDAQKELQGLNMKAVKKKKKYDFLKEACEAHLLGAFASLKREREFTKKRLDSKSQQLERLSDRAIYTTGESVERAKSLIHYEKELINDDHFVTLQDKIHGAFSTKQLEIEEEIENFGKKITEYREDFVFKHMTYFKNETEVLLKDAKSIMDLKSMGQYEKRMTGIRKKSANRLKQIDDAISEMNQIKKNEMDLKKRMSEYEQIIGSLLGGKNPNIPVKSKSGLGMGILKVGLPEGLN